MVAFSIYVNISGLEKYCTFQGYILSNHFECVIMAFGSNGFCNKNRSRIDVPAGRPIVASRGSVPVSWRAGGLGADSASD